MCFVFSRHRALYILTLALDTEEWLASHPGHITTMASPWYQLDRGLGEASYPVLTLLKSDKMSGTCWEWNHDSLIIQWIHLSLYQLSYTTKTVKNVMQL